MNDYDSAIERHYDNVWHCKGRTRSFYAKCRIADINRHFKIIEILPIPARPMWSYATVGMAGESGDRVIELHVFSDTRNLIWIEILEAVAYFHLTEARLGVGHTVNFGVGVSEGSQLTHGLISLPYLDGETLELFRYGNNVIRCLWLIPISQSELDYKKQYGLERLEKLFELNNFEYANLMRRPLI